MISPQISTKNAQLCLKNNVLANLRKFLDRKSQKRLCPQIANPQNASFAKVRKSDQLFKSTFFPICDLQNLFADLTPCYLYYVYF
jgi:hypothetical protein